MGKSAAMALSVGLVLAGSATADTFTPTRFDDPAPPNKCKPGDCSLREAVKAANNGPGLDQILLQDGTYKLEIPNDGTFSGLESGDLDLYTKIELRGQGADETRIDANGVGRVISHGCGVGPALAVTIEDLTVKDGDPGDDPFNCELGDRTIGGG